MLQLGDYVGMTPRERTAHITMRLLCGEQFTMRKVAEQYAITYRSAYNTLYLIARVIPVYYDSDYRVWKLVENCLPKPRILASSQGAPTS